MLIISDQKNWDQSNQSTRGHQTIYGKQYSKTDLLKMSLRFEVNKGQAEDHVDFIAFGKGTGISLSNNQVVFNSKTVENTLLTNNKIQPEQQSIKMKLLDSNPYSKAEGQDKLPRTSSYYVGNNPLKWKKDIENYAAVKYLDVYPGIDLLYYSKEERLEYDFAIDAGADPGTIKLEFEGIKNISFRDDNSLVFCSETDTLMFTEPVVYQERDSIKQIIPAYYVLNDNQQIGFEISQYDESLPLFIDPELVYSTYIEFSRARGCKCQYCINDARKICQKIQLMVQLLV